MTLASVAPAVNSEPGLPLELVENIIDLLRFHPRTLRATCLVSRVWMPICRAHLFRRIVLHWCDDGLQRSDMLLSLLIRAPDIAYYIRELSVHEGLISFKGSQVTFCFAQSPSLPRLLHLLPKLRLLELRASTLTYWSELSGELANAVLHAIASTCPLLDEVSLESWNFASQPGALEALLNAVSKSVKILLLTNIVTPAVPSAHHHSATGATVIRPYLGGLRRQMPLKSLTCNDSSLPFLTRWFYKKLTAIRSVHLSCSTDQANISEFLSLLGAQLEELVLDIRTPHGSEPVDFTHNTRLHSLRLHTTEHPPIPSQSNIFLSWLVDTLSTVRSFEFLEVLHIGFGMKPDFPHRLSQSDAPEWSRLDKILSPKRYHRLCTVKIGIRFHCHDELGYIEEAQSWMPNLCGRGHLDIYNDTRRFCMEYC